MPMYNAELQLYRKLLEKKLALAAWFIPSIWKNLTGFIGAEGNKNRPVAQNYGSAQARKMLTATGKPIEVMTDFQFEGGLGMDIPVLYPLTDDPLYGGVPLLGTEESLKKAYKTTRLNQVRKAILVRDTKMSDQAIQKAEHQMRLLKNVTPHLYEFISRWNSYQPYEAIFKGYSSNITASTANGGLGLTQKSHPNLYINGVGQVTFSNTPATYENAVAAGLGNLQNTSQYWFSTETIEHARYVAARSKIEPVTLGDFTGYVMIISDAQMYQLQKDSKWYETMKDAGKRNEKLNRLFSGRYEGIYRGVMIVSDPNNYGAKISGMDGYSSTYGTVNYGTVSPWRDPLSDSFISAAIVLGKSAITCAYGDSPSITDEYYDYGQKHGKGLSMLIGYERSDIYDQDGDHGTAGNFKENTSSLLVFTYSPRINLSWVA